MTDFARIGLALFVLACVMAYGLFVFAAAMGRF